MPRYILRHAVTDFASPLSKGASYLLQAEVMKTFQVQGYKLYVIGTLAEDGDNQKLQNISAFKEKFGSLYYVEGDGLRSVY